MALNLALERSVRLQLPPGRTYFHHATHRTQHRVLCAPGSGEVMASSTMREKMHSYPEINQFRQVVKYLTRDGNTPVLEYYGTVKLHGTHTDIIQRSDSSLIFQSRNRELTPEGDLYGFAAFASALSLTPLFQTIRERAAAAATDDVTTCGEWCGSGIQKGVAIAQLSRRFVIFDINVGGRWQRMQDFADIHDEAQLVYNIMQFPVYHITVDFGAPEEATAKLAALTQAVEDDCPAGRFFGVQGEGEGIVWKPVDAAQVRNSQTWFKVKGPKHSVVRVSKSRDAAAPRAPKMKGVQQFVRRCITDNRCEQGLAIVTDAARAAGGKEAEGQLPVAAFLKWIVADVAKEEGDVIEENGWKPNDVNRAVSTAAREWLLERHKNAS